MKSAYELKHVSSVRAWALLHDGKEAGRVVANFSDNPAGSVCTCTVNIWAGKFKDLPSMTGKAGGYGYCKFSAAFADAFWRQKIECSGVNSAGETAMERFLDEHGYSVIRVL